MSWQTMLADLALILFMVTAAAMGEPPAPAANPRPSPDPSHEAGSAAPWSAEGEPLAIWRETPGGTPLANWLAQQAADQRQQLTVAVRYRPRHLPAALAAARQLANSAEANGRTARIIVEPLTGGDGAGAGPGGNNIEVTAGLAYDRPGPAARAIGT